jgi:pimeloyl-ACP methyl ester carboxylesterase
VPCERRDYTDDFPMIAACRICRPVARCAAAACLWAAAMTGCAHAPRTETLKIRGRDQVLRIYGTPGGDPIVVSSGDGGWIHLAPDAAEFLAAKGFFVVGFDVRAYLAGFTSGKVTLGAEDAPGDYRALAVFASKGTRKKPILVGVSAGAGLSVLAAADPLSKTAFAGVVAVGLPARTELGWRWRDSVIYVTHAAPNEPTFGAAELVGKVAPLPLAVIHSTHDEFSSLGDVEQLLQGARPPSRLWSVAASDHRFSDNLAEFDRRLAEAVDWIRHSAKP